jgi:hypothetical protein
MAVPLDELKFVEKTGRNACPTAAFNCGRPTVDSLLHG